MRLSKDQVTEALARLSPAAKASPSLLRRPRGTATDQATGRRSSVPTVTKDQFATVQKRLEEVPPVQFDVARQVRVFNAYLQYVELKLSGAAIQRHRLAIPPSIQKLGGSKDLRAA